MRKDLLGGMTALAVLALDQLTKLLASRMTESLALIPGIFHLTLIRNPGALWGILEGQRAFFIVFSFVVLGAVAWSWKNIPEKDVVPVSLLVGGVLGNLMDRIFRGTVIDFLDFRVWPVFNFADSAIVVAVVWLLLREFRRTRAGA